MDDFGSELKLHQKDIRASFSFPSHCFKMQKNAKNCKKIASRENQNNIIEL